MLDSAVVQSCNNSDTDSMQSLWRFVSVPLVWSGEFVMSLFTGSVLTVLVIVPAASIFILSITALAVPVCLFVVLLGR